MLVDVVVDEARFFPLGDIHLLPRQNKNSLWRESEFGLFLISQAIRLNLNLKNVYAGGNILQRSYQKTSENEKNNMN